MADGDDVTRKGKAAKLILSHKPTDGEIACTIADELKLHKNLPSSLSGQQHCRMKGEYLDTKIAYPRAPLQSLNEIFCQQDYRAGKESC